MTKPIFSKPINADLLSTDGEIVLQRQILAETGAPILVAMPVSDHPSAAALGRLANEYSIRTELDGEWAAVPLTLSTDRRDSVLLLSDPGGAPLDRHLGQPVETGQFLELAISLAATLRKMHERGVIHKDIKPANILVDDAMTRSWLTGFGHASSNPREHRLPSDVSVVAGTFAYMAPEQTGRMNRSVDSRSDLYSLGVVLYEILTGELPFTASEPLEWMYCHIARKPVAPIDRLPSVPAQISAMTMKLLAKNGEERYQTAAGLEADLRRCQAQWKSDARIDGFTLAVGDVPTRLIIREVLYGREHESMELARAFDRVMQTGVTELVMVSGYSGVGKSALVHELLTEVVARRALFVSGKFDQTNRDIPFASVAQAFGNMVRQILTQGEAQIAAWRKAILDEIGINGQVLVDLIPEVEWVIGPQAQVVQLSPTQGKNRFQAVFRKFISVCATAEHPLILFLDDMQWTDPASLSLLEYLGAQDDIRHVLMIGAYRENEVSATHRFILALDVLRKTKTAVNDIVLAPLAPADMLRLVGDAIRSDDARVQSLSDVIHQKTGGNPFFAIQFISSLVDERLLVLDPTTHSWAWDIAQIVALDFTDNVVDLMAEKLQKLPAATLHTLTRFACIGHRASLATIARICGTTEEAVAPDLQQAVRAGYIAVSDKTYRFVHDRIQEAAYSLITAASLPAIHLSIGRVLLSGLRPHEIDEKVFEIVDHFNKGIELIVDSAERATICKLNASAGKKARQAIAYAAARSYLEHATSLLEMAAWTTDNHATFDLYLTRAECEFLTGNLERADEFFDLVVGKADSILDQAEALRLRMQSYQSAGRYKDALAIGLDAMRRLGLQFPEGDAEIQTAYESEQQAFLAALGERKIAELVALPTATDAIARALMSLLGDLGAIAYNARPVLTPLVYCKALNMALQFGNAEASCMTYISYGSFSVARGDIPGAFAFAELGLRLNEKFNDIKLRGTLLYVQGAHINLWKRPLSTSVPILEQGFVACQEVGNFVFASFNAALLVAIKFEVGEQLDDGRRIARRYAAFAREIKNDVIYQWTRIYERLAANLMGATPELLSFDDESFSEARCLAIITEGNHTGGIVNFHLARQVAFVMHGQFEEALIAADACTPILKAVRSMPLEASHHFFHCLSVTALYSGASIERQEEFNEILAQKIKLLEFWAANCPENYVNRFALVSAEIARIAERDLDAMRLYDEAILSARTQGFVQNEGLANEFACRFYADRGFVKIALTYARDARASYLRWGAHAIVARIDREYPGLDADSRADTRRNAETTVDQLDLMTVLKASQAVSDDIVLDSLIEKLMTISIEHAGADRGLLILIDQDGHHIAAEASTSRDGVTVNMGRFTSGALPGLILNYVLRSHEKVVIDDVNATNPFAADPYLLNRHPKSILCLPLLKQASLVGVLYLENHLTPGAFSSDRTAILEILASQAAISLENATLYANLQSEQTAIRELNANLEQRVAARTADLKHALREQDAILDNALTGIAFIRNRNILRCNEAFEKLFGFDRGELTGKSSRVLYASDEEFQRVTESVYRPLRTGVSVSGDIQRTRKDGTQFWCTSHVKLINPDDPERGLVWVVQDITARKETEQILAERSQALQASLDQLAERSVDLEAARDRADQASSSKSEFLANMSHEIRTPINAISGFTALALRTDLNPKQADYLGKIQTATQGLLRIINDLLDFSKIEAGHLEMERIPFRMREVMESTVTYVDALIERKGLELLIHIDPDVPQQCLGDPLRLGQVLINLCSNAVKFTERGEVEISVTVAARGDDSTRLHFAVRDTGIGLTPEQSGKLFQAFTQGDTSTTRKFGGTGLGLAISQRLVGMMQGRIWLESKEGVGTTFFFDAELGNVAGVADIVLPQSPDNLHGQPALVVDGNADIQTAQPEAAALTTHGRLPGVRLLLVEDNPINQQIASELLQQEGGDVHIAGNGRIALELLERVGIEYFDVALLDLQMPEMDGYETAQRVRQLPANEQLPLIAMTAHAMREERERCLALGMQDHLAKPIDPELMVAKIMHWIGADKLAVAALRSRQAAVAPSHADLPDRLPGIDMAAGLKRCSGNRQLYQNLLVLFHQHYSDASTQIRALCEAGNFSDAYILAHTIKGAAANLSMTELADAAAEIEKVCKAGFDAESAARYAQMVDAGDLS